MSWDEFTVTVPQSGLANSAIRDVTFDFPRDEALASIGVDQPMADFLRSSYMLRRICGNVFVSVSNVTGVGGDDLSAVAVSYAMFVARADEVNNHAIPIGAGNAQEIQQNYNPQSALTVREPYIFVKNWILGNSSLFAARPTSGPVRFPQTNATYGSAMEGTFIDQKTLRRISDDNRLWHIVSVRGYPLREVHTTGNLVVTVNPALRYLGRPASGTRARGSF